MTIIYRDAHYVIEHLCAGNTAAPLICTFTPFDTDNLDTPGYAVSFFTKRGYDVISFRCNNSSWYQALPLAAVEMAGAVAKRYPSTVTYGSSMGGYAAIVFARMLGAKTVIAISPQFAINQDFDKRWIHFAKKITWQYSFDPDLDARVYMVYDPVDTLDVAQITRLREALPRADIHDVLVPVSGHPSGIVLAEVGQLKPMLLAAVAHDDIPPVILPWSVVGQSSQYLMALAAVGTECGRDRLAEVALQRLLAQKPQFWAAHTKLSKLYERAGQTLRAINHAALAMASMPDSTALRADLEGLLRRSDDMLSLGVPWSVGRSSKNYMLELGKHAASFGRPALAELCFRRCLSLDARNAPALRNLTNVLAKRGRRDEILSLGLPWSVARSSKIYMLTLGRYAAGSDRPALAVRCLRRCLILDARSAPAFFELSRMFVKQGLRDAAIDAAQSACDCAPGNPAMRRNLDKLLAVNAATDGAV